MLTANLRRMRRAQLEAKPPMRATEPVAAGISEKIQRQDMEISAKNLNTVQKIYEVR